jgi:hypothetical protein
MRARPRNLTRCIKGGEQVMKKKRLELVLSPEEQWFHARDIVLGALATAGVEVIFEADIPRSYLMRIDLWSHRQQSEFAYLEERLKARPMPEKMFSPHMTVDVVINNVKDYRQEEGLLGSL